MLIGWLKVHRPRKVSNEMKCTNEKNDMKCPGYEHELICGHGYLLIVDHTIVVKALLPAP